MSKSAQVHGTVWLSAEDFCEEDLPWLLNSTARRKKTLDSLFPHLRGQIYRCKEFPHGVYINDFGEVCPDHPNSGIYQCFPAEADEVEAAENMETEDEDNDNQFDTDDEYWKEEEDKVLAKKRKRSSDSDEDTASAEEEEDEESITEDTDDDWQPERKKKQKRLQVLSDDEEGEVKAVTSSSESDAESESDSSGSSVKEEEEDVLNQETMADMDRLHAIQLENRQQRVKTQKLIAFLEVLIEDWTTIRKAEEKKKRAELPLTKKKTSIQLGYESALQSSEPTCTFSFRKPGSAREIKGSLNCKDIAIKCECGQEPEYTTAEGLYEHVSTHFVEI